MNLKKLQTNKLFYGKYAYKISTQLSGGHLIRYIKIDKLKAWCEGTEEISWLRNIKQIDKTKLHDYACNIEPFLPEKIQIRTERNTVNIFVSERNLYENIKNSLIDYVQFVSEPANDVELSAMLNDTTTVLCNQLPKGHYRYKVILKNMPVDLRKKFLDWSGQYQNQLHLPPGTIKHLKVLYPWWGDHYFYVVNDQMLLLTRLFVQGYVRKVEEYKLKSSINTSS